MHARNSRTHARAHTHTDARTCVHACMGAHGTLIQLLVACASFSSANINIYDAREARTGARAFA